MRSIRRAVDRRRTSIRESLTIMVGDVLPPGHFLLTSAVPLAIRQRQFRPFIRYGWSEIPANLARFVGFEVELQIELEPRSENRVTLTQVCDRYGRPLANVRWNWGDLDLRTLRRMQCIIAEEFSHAGLGQLQIPAPDASPTMTSQSGAHHHMGTTRMHEDPKLGVVDANCQAHGVHNLFIAGSSVFPTGGYANPTLTIVALSIRLADRIKQLINAGTIGQ